MKKQRRRARRLSPAERRQQLLECAIKSFSRRGLGRGGHADVANEAAVAVATVFTYFKTKEQLLGAVVSEVERYFEAMAVHHHRSDKPAPRALLDHAIAFATSVETDPDYARLLLEWSTATRDEIWPLFLRFQDHMVRYCEATIRRGQVDGSIPSDLDAETSALMMIGSAQLVIQMKFTHWPADRIHRFLLAQLRGAIGSEAVAAALG